MRPLPAAIVVRFALALVWAGLARAAPPPGSLDPWGEVPEAADAAWEALEQDHLPAWRARAEAARRRAEGARAASEGRAPLTVALPELDGADLDDPAVISARLIRLDDAAVARAAARGARTPSLPPGRDAAARAALIAALDAEDLADDRVRRVLIAVRAHLAARPELSAAGLAPLRAQVEAERAAARARLAADPESVDAARALAAADVDGAALEALVAGLRAHAIAPAAPVPDPAPDLERLAAGEGAAAADARLGLLGPALDPARAAAVESARAAWRWEARVPALEAEIAGTQDIGEEHTAEALRAHLAEVDAALAAAPEPPEVDPAARDLAAAEARLAALEREGLEQRRGALLAALGAAERRESAARTAAQEARESQRAALEEAGQAGSEATASLLTAVAEANERAAARFDRASNVERWADSSRAARAARVEAVRAAVAEVELAEQVLLGGPDADPDGAYAAGRREVARIRAETERASALRDRVVAEARASAEGVRADQLALAAVALGAPDTEARRGRDELVARWRTALAEEARAAVLAVDGAEAARDAVLVDLRAMKAARRALRPHVSAEQRRVDWDRLPEDAGWEAALFGPNLLSLAHAELSAAVALPLNLLSPAFLLAFLGDSFWALALVALWWTLRQRAELAVDAAIARLPAVRREGVARVRGPTVAVLRAVLDLGAGLLLREPLGAILPVLGVAVWLYLQVALFRLALAAFDLLVAPHGDARPGVVTLGRRVHALARRTVRWALVWWIARTFVRQVLQDGLGSDAIDTLARTGIDLAGLGALVALLDRWAPALREQIRGFHQESRWVRLLSSDPRTRLLEAPLAVPTAAYLTAAFSWDRLQHLARERQGLGRLLAMATRMTLPRDDERRAAAVALAPEVREALVADRVDGWAERSAERALREAAAAWEAARVRGVVLVTGDVGDGKRALLDRILPELAATRRVVRARLDRRLLDEGDAIAWLAHALDQADLPGELEAAIDAIEALPPAVIAVEGLERAFLRTVGGFSGLRALLYALNAISGRHLVLVTAHRLAWAYLRRLGPIVNVEVVRETIDLEPLGEKATRRLALERLRAAGHEVRFDALVRPSPFGVDPAVERERATGAFFQLLADAAEGNPEVAMHLLSRCLVAHSDGSLEVRVHESLGSASLTELTENEMFTLVALRTQGQLTEEELVGVTNLGPGVIRNVVRNLVSRGLLARDGALCSVRVDQLPAVTRTLRRRHFLHFSG